MRSLLCGEHNTNSAGHICGSTGSDVPETNCFKRYAVWVDSWQLHSREYQHLWAQLTCGSSWLAGNGCTLDCRQALPCRSGTVCVLAARAVAHTGVVSGAVAACSSSRSMLTATACSLQMHYVKDAAVVAAFEVMQAHLTNAAQSWHLKQGFCLLRSSSKAQQMKTVVNTCSGHDAHFCLIT